MSLKRRLSLSTALITFALALFVGCFPALGVAQTASSAVPVASRLTQPIDEKQLVALKGTVHKLATAANDRGAVDDAMPLERVQVMLKRSPAQEAALRQTLQGLHQPGSANYHKWLTPAQFGEQFGPSDADIATIANWLSSHGFTVTKVNPGKQTLEFSGSAGQFNKTFHSQIHKYQVNGQTHTANASDPSIPAALAPVFGGFASLNNFPMKSYSKVLGRALYNTATHKATPEWTTTGGPLGYNFVLAPGDFAVQYDLNPLYKAGTTGAGQTIGIINEANISVPLVNQYRTLFGLPANPPNVIVDGNDPGIDGVNNPDGPNYASVEAYLDVEEAGAVAPAATIDLIVAADTAIESGLLLAGEHAIYGNVAPVLSLSFGACEPDLGYYNGLFLGLWEQAAAQGQTVTVSSGDAGSATCDDDNIQSFAVYGQQVNGEASTPWNVAVGGTDFYYSNYNTTESALTTQLEQYWGNFLGGSTGPSNASNATPTTTLLSKVPEQPWNNSQYGKNIFILDSGSSTIGGGGGGASNCALTTNTGACAGYPKPPWQTGAGVPADGVRDLPDVSLFAANGFNNTYYPICAEDGDCQPVASGGDVTFTGVGGTSASAPAFAGIMALVNQKYGPQGQADFVLYPLAKQYPSAFNDVTVGSNSVPCNLQTVYYYGAPTTPIAPNDCIPTSDTVTATDPLYGKSTEGQIGNTSTNTAEYNAGVGYDLASGLGSVDANNLVTNWGNVKFTSSSVTLSSSQTSFPHGTPVTISGSVTPGAATGAVSLETTSSEPLQAAETTFAVGANGAYSGTVSYLPGGTYDIYGTYSGDGTYGASTSSKTSITVTAEASSTTLELLQSGGYGVTAGGGLPYGTQLLLDAYPGSLNPQNTTSVPTGTVTFLNGTTTIGTATVNSEGVAELNYSPLPSSTPYSITAQYSGDASYGASTSAATSFTVSKDTPQVTLYNGTPSQIPTAVAALSGESSLTVSVENYANVISILNGQYAVNSALAPTGVVTVSGLPSGTLTFPALSAVQDPLYYFVDGVATLALPIETSGTYPVTISYPGDANYSSATANATVTITAPAGIPTTTTASVPAAATISTGATLSYTVTGTTAGGPPTGSVTIYSAGQEIYSDPIPSGGTGDTFSDTISLNGALPPGSNQLVVQYSGSSVYAPSSAIATIEDGGAPAIGLADSGAITVPSGIAGSGTSTITVNPFNGFTGSVALACAVTPSNGASVPTCTVASPVALSGTSAGTATLSVATTATTAAGNYTVTVTATSGGLLQTVAVPLTVASITLSNSGAITIPTPGGSGSSTITVLNLGTIPAGQVSLSCAVTGVSSTDAPVCSLSAVAGSTGGSATSTLTVTTTAASAALELPRPRMLPIGGGIAAAVLLFFVVPKKRRRLSTLLGLAMLMAGVGLSTGCGGGRSSNSNPGTLAGTYTVTVTGTADGGPIAPTNVTVTVQ